jgi:hypothetical protein
MEDRSASVDDIPINLNTSNNTALDWIVRRAIPGQPVTINGMLNQDGAHERIRSRGAADKSDKPDIEQ